MSGLDPVLSPTRLQICAYLSGCEVAEYSAVQDYLGVSKPTLSKALTALAERDWVRIEKVQHGRYARTTLQLTDAGAAALADHVTALQRLAEQAAHAGSATGPLHPQHGGS